MVRKLISLEAITCGAFSMVRKQELTRQILTLLPRDGTPLRHSVIKARIGQKVGSIIDGELYHDVVSRLASKKLVIRSRGPGGRIARANPLPPEKADHERWTEVQLMPCLKRYLSTRFRRQFDNDIRSYWDVIDTSAVGPAKRWTRPDFAVVRVVPLKLLERRRVDILSFELKAVGAVDVRAVYQTLNQTQKSNYGFLVWHVPPGSPQERDLTEILADCRRCSIGLIRIVDPDDVETWTLELQPQRQTTEDLEVDRFLESRLKGAALEGFLNALRGK